MTPDKRAQTDLFSRPRLLSVTQEQSRPVDGGPLEFQGLYCLLGLSLGLRKGRRTVKGTRVLRHVLYLSEKEEGVLVGPLGAEQVKVLAPGSLELLCRIDHVVVIHPDEAVRSGLAAGGAQAAEGHIGRVEGLGSPVQVLKVHQPLFDLQGEENSPTCSAAPPIIVVLPFVLVPFLVRSFSPPARPCQSPASPLGT